MSNNDNEKINSIANDIMMLAHDELLMNMRFLDSALYKLSVTPDGVSEHAYTGEALLYDTTKLIKEYKKDINLCKRLYLHSILHCVFAHTYDSKGRDRKLWDLATDIAVENIILDFDLGILKLQTDDLLKNRIFNLKKELKRFNKGSASLSAQKIYRYFLIEDLSEEGYEEWVKLTKRDTHIYWDIEEIIDYSYTEWQK
ncbi:MAG: hypothetical protein Q4D29_12935, partial [Lachnospiraceae bacterium]|nr:hypothetical protein [Lachnospiraceae bacterium]